MDLSSLSRPEWDAIRRKVLDLVQRVRTSDFPGLRLEAIDHEALSEAKTWNALSRRVVWDWARIVKHREADRIELAIWLGDTLCGLAYGGTCETAAMLTRLEARPSDNPLQGHITDLAIAVLETHAHALDRPNMLLEDPDPGLIKHYGRWGYTKVAKPNGVVYLAKQRPRQ